MGFGKLRIANAALGLLSFIAVSFASAQASAAERYVLDLNHQTYIGDNTLRLKEMLREQYGVNPRRLSLLGVRLVAKTQLGRGTATLQVGNWESNPVRVGGNPEDFGTTDPRTYGRVDYNVEGIDSFGPWQIHLNGRFRVLRVVLFVENSAPGGIPGDDDGFGRVRYYDVRCQSGDNRFQYCPLPATGRVVSLRVIRQRSILPCEEGRSFGIERNALWVDRGCRADFEVGIRSR